LDTEIDKKAERMHWMCLFFERFVADHTVILLDYSGPCL